MNRIFTLAWQYTVFHRTRTIILVLCIALSGLLPVVVQIWLTEFQRLLFARATATPLVVGSPGSRFDLVLHSLYFDSKAPSETSMQEQEYLQDAELGRPIPLYVRFTARKYAVVGTSLDYFNFRQLKIKQGEMLTRLGDCVLGARVAETLKLKPGDSIMSDPENVFDIAGVYPLKMRIRGVLAPNDTADDHAVFVDVKTAWVIAGIGHGHQDAEKANSDQVLDRKGKHTVANAALPQYNEITDDNIASFHFHGTAEQFPLTSILVDTEDERDKVLLEGRYQSREKLAQILRPDEVIKELMSMVFRVKRFFDANAILVAGSTVLFILLVVILSLRLRQKEMETMFRLGCSRGNCRSHSSSRTWDCIPVCRDPDSDRRHRIFPVGSDDPILDDRKLARSDFLASERTIRWSASYSTVASMDVMIRVWCESEWELGR